MSATINVEKIKLPPADSESGEVDNSFLQNEEEALEIISLIEAENERSKKAEIETIKSTTGMAGGALMGVAIGGPVGALIGGVLGLVMTEWANRKRKD